MAGHRKSLNGKSHHAARTAAMRAVALVLSLALAAAPALAERTRLKPGTNMFTPEQDVQIGRQAAAQAEQQLPIIRDTRVDAYINNLGKRLAAKAPGPRFPYSFRVVNDKAINAFCLPGGQIFVNRGVIEQADNEGQLAGVIGHEIGHAAMRHGTNQATKAQYANIGMGILGAVLGSGSLAAVATQLGAGFTAQSILLKYSRDAERQSDIIGTQILYDLKYDPRAMAQFFEKLEAESKGGRPPQFFSSHPSPVNRIEGVNSEIQKLGGAPPNYRTDSAEFREIKRLLSAMPAPVKGQKGAVGGAGGGTGTAGGRPEAPSSRYQTHDAGTLTVPYPDNWKVYAGRERGNVAFAPEGGIVDDGRGGAAIGYAVLVGLATPQADRSGNVTLEGATEQLLQQIQQGNPDMRFENRRTRIRINGEPGLSVFFTNKSPFGGREVGWVVTILRRDGLVNFICVAPENEFDRYDRTFQEMIGNVKFR